MELGLICLDEGSYGEFVWTKRVGVNLSGLRELGLICVDEGS